MLTASCEYRSVGCVDRQQLRGTHQDQEEGRKAAHRLARLGQRLPEVGVLEPFAVQLLRRQMENGKGMGERPGILFGAALAMSTQRRAVLSVWFTGCRC